MFQRPSKYLMNEADGSSGNGAPAAPAPPAQPQAQPAATPAPAVVPVDQLAGVIAEQMTSLRNGIFADLRKAGVFKGNTQEAQAPTPSPAPAPVTPAAPALADPMAVLALRDAFDDATSELKLDKGQRQLLREHVMTRRPNVAEVDSIVSDFVKRANWVTSTNVPSASAATPPQPVTQPQTQAPPPAPAKPNVSDRGSASPVDLRDSEGVLNSRPLEMTGHDVDALVLKHGRTKGLQMFQARVLDALSKVKIKPPR